jgi:uncharacterized protein YecE (DUF72 family)
MGTYYIGTSGFSYADWLGPFYPEGLKKTEFLPYYAERFPFVELNFTYYRQPAAAAMEKLIARTPSGFLFSVKAHGSMTHEREEDWKRSTATFLEGISPQVEAESLAGVLLQFPYSFHYTKENRYYLASLTEEMQGREELPLLVEFRNNEWSGPRVDEELRRRGVGKVVTDTPQLRNLPETEPVCTAPTSYLRLHGRNKENWWTGDNTSRYDYRYSESELNELLPVIQGLMSSARRLFIAFNNHHKGQAADNALMLRDMLEKRLDGQSDGQEGEAGAARDAGASR